LESQINAAKFSPLEVGNIYRGRLAPTPTGFMHLGHARTFWIAQERARAAGGLLILRNDDLDRTRVKPEYVRAFLEDLRWFGLAWAEGPDIGGPCAPYDQSARLDLYRQAFANLRQNGLVYPCTCSRQDVLRALHAPHQGEEEPLYPGTCRGKTLNAIPAGAKVSWRFRTSDGEDVSFEDGTLGSQTFRAGKEFGDFVVWRHDDLPSYQLACVVDDALMQITEVVRGADLLMSTARQLLLFRALGFEPPDFYHCELMTDEHGVRLAKRNDALSLRELRARGKTPEQVKRMAEFKP
jgi:glutamyl/glutaminyl-tRNA synthetase